MILYKHRTSRDTAFALPDGKFKEGRQYVSMFNINWAKITNERPLYLGLMEITVKPIEEYKVITYEK